jgi:hypothetical protein
MAMTNQAQAPAAPRQRRPRGWFIALASLGLGTLVILSVCLALFFSAVSNFISPKEHGAGATHVGLKPVKYGDWDHRVVFAIVFEHDDVDKRPEVKSGDGSASQGSTTEYFGYISSPMRVEWSCRTTDAATGVMAINQQKFQLADGSLFLVSTREGTARVTQVKRRTAERTVGTLKNDLAADPDVARFIDSQARAE